jgi:hypothetical protein
MRNERLKLFYLIMLCVSLIVFCFSLFIILEIKQEEVYKMKYNKLIESIKRKPITK